MTSRCVLVAIFCSVIVIGLGGKKKEDSFEEQEEVGEEGGYMRCISGETGGRSSLDWRAMSESEFSSLKESRSESDSRLEDRTSEEELCWEERASGEELWFELESKDRSDGDKEGDSIG